MVANQIIPFNVNASIEAVKQLSEIVSGLREQVFRNGHDYGVIPGTGEKPTLLLPGMEKLMRALRLRAEYHAVSITEDFDKGLFAYRYECRLIEYDTGLCVATAIGSCNSKESKYRWRQGERKCPHCNKATIIKGKEEYGGGWLCFAKKGGCGAKFKSGDQTIEGQSVERVENPDIYDQVNTIDKIAQKRALASAIKGAANVSEHFTVDLEDLYRYEYVVEGMFTEVEKPAAPEPEKPAETVDKATGEIKPTDAPKLTRADLDSALNGVEYEIKPTPGGFARVVVKGTGDQANIESEVAARGFRILTTGKRWFDTDLRLYAEPH